MTAPTREPVVTTPAGSRTTRKPRLLAGFCGVGGCTRGYQNAGWNVFGVDISPQPRYAGGQRNFYQGDAIDFIYKWGHQFDAAHVGPPCQHDCTLTAGTNAGKFTYPDLLEPTREALESVGIPYVIEQPPGRASKRMRVDLTLCGEMFGLSVIRHRNFELGGWTIEQPEHIKHRGRVAGMRHGPVVRGPVLRGLRRRRRQGHGGRLAARHGHQLDRRPQGDRRGNPASLWRVHRPRADGRAGAEGRRMNTRNLALIATASFGAGLLAYYAIDRITFLTGHTIRDIRHAGRPAA